MDQHTALLVEIASHVRTSHQEALFAIAYLATPASETVLSDLLSGLQELRRTQTSPSHYEAFRERWGRYPG